MQKEEISLKKILVCNQKGGVGKSLIADELAFSFERSNIPMAFLDLDNQGGTIHKTNQREDAEVVVVDTPGALQTQLAIWMADADTIVIPTRTTSRDIEPLLRIQEIAIKNAPNTPIVYVFNGYTRWKASSDFQEWFRQHQKNGQIVTLPQSEKFVQASAAGVSVVDFAKWSSAGQATIEMVEKIRSVAGFINKNNYKN